MRRSIARGGARCKQVPIENEPPTIASAHRQRHRTTSATSPATPALRACTACGERTQPADLYLADTGEVCALCYADADAQDSLERGARDQAVSVFLAPGFVALALIVLEPIARFTLPQPDRWLALVPLFSAFIGIEAMRRAATGPGLPTADRVKLGLAGLSTTLILGALALALGGIIG